MLNDEIVPPEESQDGTDQPVIIDRRELQVQLKKNIAKIQRRRQQIYKETSGGATQYSNKTNMQFKFADNSPVISLLTATNLEFLIKVLSFLKRLEKDYNETAEELGLQKYPVPIWTGNYTIPDWISDVTRRALIVSHQEELDQLHLAETKLKTFLSEDDRLSQTLQEVGDMFNKKGGKSKATNLL